METHLGEFLSLEEAKHRFGLSPIVQQFGTWAVTEYGIECLTARYRVPRSRIYSATLIEHMAEKRWCNQAEFKAALTAAQLHFSSQPAPVLEHVSQAEVKRSKRVREARQGSFARRFVVFKRDAYRCQICGVTAQDGARLEVDHKVPLAGGGSNDLANLWTLCFECNRGKGTKSL